MVENGNGPLKITEAEAARLNVLGYAQAADDYPETSMSMLYGGFGVMDSFIEYTLGMSRLCCGEMAQHQELQGQYAMQQEQISANQVIPEQDRISDPGDFVASSEYLTGAKASMNQARQEYQSIRFGTIRQAEVGSLLSAYLLKDSPVALPDNLSRDLAQYEASAVKDLGTVRGRAIGALDVAKIASLTYAVQVAESKRVLNGLEKQLQAA